MNFSIINIFIILYKEAYSHLLYLLIGYIDTDYNWSFSAWDWWSINAIYYWCLGKQQSSIQFSFHHIAVYILFI